MSDNDYNNLEKLILTMLSIVSIMLLALLMSGCKQTEYVYVPTHSTDTLYINKVQRDSIKVHDSIYVHEWTKGDTIFVESSKWLTKYVEKEVHDTIYQAKHDSVPVPYPVPQYVEKELTWWQRTKMKAGIAFIVLLVASALFGIYKFLKRFGIIKF